MYNRLSLEYALLFLLNLALFISCSHEEEMYDPPVIQWFSPSEDADYRIGDSIQLRANISDDRIIEKITIQLKNEGGGVVQNWEPILPNSSSYEINQSIVLDQDIKGGRFYMEIRAFNQVSQIPAFRYFNIVSSLPSVDRLFLIRTFSQQTSIQEFVNDTLKVFATSVGDFLSSHFDAASGQLFSSGEYNGNFTARSTTDTLEQWSVKAEVFPSVPYFTFFGFYYDHCVLSLNSGLVKVFRQDGLQRLEVQFEPGFKAGIATIHSDKYMILERIDKSSEQVYLESRYFPSGAIHTNEVFNFGDIAGVIELNDLALILSENSDTKYILEYDPATGIIEEMRNFNAGKIHSYLKGQNDIIYIAAGNGLYSYQLSTRTIKQLSGLGPFKVLRNDPRQSSLIGLNANQLITFDLDGNKISELEMPEDVASFELIVD